MEQLDYKNNPDYSPTSQFVTTVRPGVTVGVAVSTDKAQTFYINFTRPIMPHEEGIFETISELKTPGHKQACAGTFIDEEGRVNTSFSISREAAQALMELLRYQLETSAFDYGLDTTDASVVE